MESKKKPFEQSEENQLLEMAERGNGHAENNSNQSNHANTIMLLLRNVFRNVIQ